MVIRVFWASVTGNRKVNGDQTRLRYIIESINIPSEWIDITTDPLVREKMREECGNPKAMPPQIFNEFRYLGEVADMEEFIEQEKLREWFGLDDVIRSDVTGDKSDTSSSDEDANEKCKIVNGDVTTEDGRPQSSPTSSIENAPPDTGTPNGVETILNGNSDPPPPCRKNVLAAAGAFEDLGKQSIDTKNSKPRVIFTQSKSINTSASEDSKHVDEERKRRILGLSSETNTNSTATIVSMKKPSNDAPERNVKKVSITSDR